MRLRAAHLIIAGILALSACGGDEAGSTDTSEDAGGASAAAATLAELVTAIEAVDYACEPESMAMTAALREICLTTTSIAVNPYAWDDAAAADQQFDAEVMCSADSTLGSISYLRGDSWAISVFSISDPTAEREAEITAVLESIQSAVGGEVGNKACG